MYIFKLFVILYLFVLTQIEASVVNSYTLPTVRTKVNWDDRDREPEIPDTKAIPILVKVSVYNAVRVKGKVLSTNSCGGSYIRPNWVLSATHCVEAQLPLKNHKSKFDVKLCMGSIEKSCPKRFTRLADELHPYSDRWKDNDIMLIKVLKPWVLGPTIQIAKFPPPKVPLKSYNKKQCLIAGWGLKQAMVTLYVNEGDKCVTSNDKQICAVGGSGTCKGDSGGLLLCDGILVGVLQGGIGACNSTTTKTSIFNLVESYRDWIVSVTGAGKSIVPNKLCLCIFLVMPLAIFN